MNLYNNFAEHNFQICDAKFFDYDNLIASCDISGLILIWTIKIEKNSINTYVIMKGKFED